MSAETLADPFAAPRATDGRAPDVMRKGAWVPMRQFPECEPVDFAVVGTGAGGAPLIAGLAEAGFSVVGFDAGPYFRPLEDFASDELEQNKLYWMDHRVVDGPNPITMGGKNSGKAVGGSTVHFAMVSLRQRPEVFRSRSALGFGADWPIDWREMWRYYARAERLLAIAGPLSYPWGPPRPAYPYRAHELNGAARLLARGAEALGYKWTETPLATVSAPRGLSPPCVYRGFCRFGCSTNAKQSQLVTSLPCALAAGAEIRDLAMVGRIETGPDGLATGVHYHREGRWRFQRARNVVVAGYAVETPRLLLASACPRHPNGLANSSGLVGRYLMTQSNQAVFGTMEEMVRWYKAPPSLSITEHWNYCDDKDFFGGYVWMAQGPLPVEWSTIQTGARGLWGQALRDAMAKYNHQVGLKMVGEMLPNPDNRVTLDDEVDQYGLRVARITYAWGDNDKALIAHALDRMQASLEAVGARDIFRQEDDTNHLAGTARMGFNPTDSVVNADCRSWDIPNLWVCDGSVFPTTGAVNPSLTITSIALRTVDRIKALARRGSFDPDKAMTIDTPIRALRARAYVIPTDAPESDGTLEWDSTTLVVVEAEAGDETGLGYTYAAAATARVVMGTLAPAVRGLDAFAVGAAHEAMVDRVRNIGSRGVAACAISAVDAALWDLAARLVGMPLANLLGRRRDSVPVYGSGGFTSYDDARLAEQLGGWVAEGGCAFVKMKIGRDPAADPDRIAVAREAIGEADLFVDANGAFEAKAALAAAEAMADAGVRWFEEPVSSDDLAGLRLMRERGPAGMAIAAGEYGFDPFYFRRMLAAGAVDTLQADATRARGVTGFLQAAAVADAFGVPLSSHCAPALHLHAACAAPRLVHMEWFHDHVRIEQSLFDGAPRLVAGRIAPDLSQPGAGLLFKRQDAEAWAV